MNVRLKNIGIISDSTIEIKGLTVITGHNNSGKTTVGKVVYSLVDAVSDIENKAAYDKYNYVLKQLQNANKEFSCRAIMKRGIEHISNECLRIFFSEEYKQSIGPDVLEIYLIDLINELQDFSIANEPYRTIIENDPRKAIYKTRLDMEEFYREKDKVIWVLEVTLNEITKDSELIDYAKQSINETLSVEFSGQIQPAAQDHVFSAIEVTDGNKQCFSVELRKYEAMDLCDFYQTKRIDGTAFVDYKCVNDSLEDIYEDFVIYLSDMKKLRDSYWS